MLLKLKWGPKSQQEEEEEEEVPERMRQSRFKFIQLMMSNSNILRHERGEKGFVNFDMGGLRRTPWDSHVKILCSFF